MKRFLKAGLASAVLIASPSMASGGGVAISKCAAPLGTIAIVDGDTQGWTKFGLGSPRPLLTAMIAESNCFALHDPASGKSADFLMSAIAGSKEEVDQGINVAKAALTEGALRSGALGAVAGVPFAGAALRMFGGFGGKKKLVAAGLRLISPSNGQTLAAGSGEAKKSSLSWGGLDAVAGYGSSGDGKLLSTAFATAFNSVVAQAGARTGHAAPVTAAKP
ncbi:MAG TPA: SH3 domain-containing protein [Allosphingosinicella sp.]|nr:SH3 domain-containing protein [Allosphingosinicella sp.]